MTSRKPALLGGEPVRARPYPPHHTIDEEEKRAVLRVLDSGLLSGFAARPDGEFYGGPAVLALEAAFNEHFGVRHAVAFNSATSALHACIAAAKIGPGDEVITSPYSMSASASCVLMQGGVPVFADVEPDMFCLDPVAVERAVTPRTKAILAVNLFGQPAALDPLMAIAKRYAIILIEDNAQAPAARHCGRFTGTVGHMGVFSLNRHKTIQCGEGGVAVTDDPKLSRRLQLVRNHGEVVAEDLGWPEDATLIGYNYRMTELQAAVALPQLRKLDFLTTHRVMLAEYLSQKLSGCEYLVPPRVRANCTHVYYLYPMKVQLGMLGFSRTLFAEALRAEGIPVHCGYVKPLCHLPAFKRVESTPLRCPVVETLYSESLITTNVCRYPATADDVDDVVRAVEKIAASRKALSQYEQAARTSSHERP